MTVISVCIVGQENIFKEGVKSLLARNDFDIQQDCDTLADIAAGKNKTAAPQLVVFIEEDGDDFLRTIEKIKRIYGQSRIVMIGGHMKADVIVSAVAAGAAGIILKDISCGALIGSLKLAAAGKNVYPASALMRSMRGGLAANMNHEYNLSHQETKIVSCLANGEPNKIIALHLGISVATVKVHIRTILRKLGTTNRTQAAILAVSEGLASAPIQMQA